jgi:tetratricopeptide (TPR) repeat protein
MKNLKLIAGIVMMASAILFSCKQKSTTGSTSANTGNDEYRKERLAHNAKLYDYALKYHDNYTELNALVNLIADDSATYTKEMDSLGMLYFKMSLYTAAEKVADRVLQKNPEDEKMLELKAQLLMGKGKLEEALNMNRKLFEKSKKIKFLFNIAEAQLQLQNMKDLNETLTKIKTDPTYQTDSIDVVDEQSGRLQKVPAPAALSFVEAIICNSKNDFRGMLSKLNQALEIYPRYVNAQNYKRALMQQMQQMQQQAPRGPGGNPGPGENPGSRHP